MSEIVHITFEKLTGLKGEIEGDFICDPQEIDQRLPFVFQNFNHELFWFWFSHNGKSIIISPTSSMSTEAIYNFLEHIKSGTNLLIKEWSHGGGVTINSQSPN